MRYGKFCYRETPMDIKETDWNQVWKEELRKRTSTARDSTYWNKRAPSFAEHAVKTGYAEAFLRIIKPKRGWSILDMGCGAGTLAIPFAEHVKGVTAVDFSETMIELLSEQSAKRGITNIRAIRASWEDDWEKAHIGSHDVAIASRSLVVENLREAIMKLGCIAKRRVYISTIVGDGPYDRHIFEAIGRELNMGPDYIYTYNLLYQMGIYANIDFIMEKNHKTYKDRDAALMSIRWMLGNMTAEEEERLKEYLDKHLIYDGGRWMMDYSNPVRWAVLWWEKEATDRGYSKPKYSKRGQRLCMDTDI